MRAGSLQAARQSMTKERDRVVRSESDQADTQGADDMSDHDEWISYSHWGMFTLERKSSRQSN
jgi:hypothetical protein